MATYKTTVSINEGHRLCFKITDGSIWLEAQADKIRVKETNSRGRVDRILGAPHGEDQNQPIWIVGNVEAFDLLHKLSSEE